MRGGLRLMVGKTCVKIDLDYHMKNKKNVIILILISIVIFAKMIIDDIKFDSYVCETKDIQLKTIIVFISGRANDTRIEVKDRKKTFSFNISKVIFNEGFSNDFIDIKEGDSIFKNSNSKLITIKRDNKKAIYELNCSN